VPARQMSRNSAKPRGYEPLAVTMADLMLEPSVPQGAPISARLRDYPCWTRRRFASAGYPRSPARRGVAWLPARTAFARGAVGRECNRIVFDAGHVLHDALAVRRPGVDAEGEASSRCAQCVEWRRASRFTVTLLSRTPRREGWWPHLLDR
jgi:hypothetical protein